MKFRVKRADRAAGKCSIGDIVHPGADAYGCADDDTRHTGIEHRSVSLNESGLPFFTIPKDDLEVA